jgi:hypothetical protein
MKRAKLALGAVIAALVFLFCVDSATAQRLLGPEEAKSVAIKDLKADASEVSGVIVNNTPHTIREIEVLIQYHWLWANEFKPGLESPGRVASLKLDKDLLPGESTTFRYVPNPPLPNRQDGRFDPEVVVAGFTIVIPPTTGSR